MYLDKFIENGLVYQAPRYQFILLKDLVEYARTFDISVKLRDLKAELISRGWTDRRASVSTTEGYQSKSIWTNSKFTVDVTRDVPIEAVTRLNIHEVVERKADELIDRMFSEVELFDDIEEMIIEDNTLIFTNNGIKEALTKLGYADEASRLSSVIRSRSDESLLGEIFYGKSSRTTLFKNYYKYKR